MSRPLIVISNDDGVLAKGLNVLVETVRMMGDVIVMAPDGGRSGAACSISSSLPVQYRLVKQEPGLTMYACTGTPVDCLKLAFETVLPRVPDLVISGINHGDNASVSVHYSGTMGVVFEGTMKGIPSVGFSLADSSEEADFSDVAKYIRGILQYVLSHGLPRGICLNVNFPKREGVNYSGLSVCRMSAGAWTSEWFTMQHPRGQQYFWLTGTFENHEPESLDTDMWAIKHNRVAVTPVRLDVTAYEMMESLKSLESL